MEKTDRELLIKEISARLPYGVKAKVYGWDEEKGEVEAPLRIYSINIDGYVYFEINDYNVHYLNVDDCPLYLRPISSMTEEEQVELGKLIGTASYNMLKGDMSHLNALLVHIYKNHIDAFGLIPQGLALEAPKEMYKTE